ncbi:MAG: hypothetical protein ACTHQ3_08635 [Motilibacteraceae bacterium]
MNDQQRIYEMVREAYRAGRAECETRRARILKHPDIAADLTKPPLNYSRPDAWSGYIPPLVAEYLDHRFDRGDYCKPCGRHHPPAVERLNNSIMRKALLDIGQRLRERELASEAA